MPRFAANLSLMFNEVDFLARFKAAATAGFKGAEFLFPYAYPISELVARRAESGLTVALFNATPGDYAQGERGIAGIPGREAEFEAGIATALAYCAALECRRLHVMAGLVHHGANRLTLVSNLRRVAARAAAAGVELLIEPINTRDIPGYLINRTAEALAIIDQAGDPQVKLQLDLYHHQIMEGDLTGALREYLPYAAHVQIAEPPDRGEPDHGEIDYRFIFEMLDTLGYAGWVGCEYRPRGDTVTGLAWLAHLGVRLDG
ncbi:MAG: TIM barrel protein [Gammaproteobacteria bacterium]|nr:TIM barrel protein [Gammaproteobacteria bacterium]